MKHTLFAALTLGTLCGAASYAAPVTLEISGVQARGGQFLVGLQTQDQFMQNAGIAGEIIQNPEAGTHKVTFDVPPGEYSVSVLHDENMDHQMAMAENGMPQEGWTMVSASSLRGEPTFDQVSFKVTKDGADLTLPMIYPAPE